MNIVKRTNIKIEYETNGRSFRRSRLTSRSASFHRDARYEIRRVTSFTLAEKIRFAHTKKSSFVNGPGNSFGHFWPKGRISLKGRRLTKQTYDTEYQWKDEAWFAWQETETRDSLRDFFQKQSISLFEKYRVLGCIGYLQQLISSLYLLAYT